MSSHWLNCNVQLICQQASCRLKVYAFFLQEHFSSLIHILYYDVKSPFSSRSWIWVWAPQPSWLLPKVALCPSPGVRDLSVCRRGDFLSYQQSCQGAALSLARRWHRGRCRCLLRFRQITWSRRRSRISLGRVWQSRRHSCEWLVILSWGIYACSWRCDYTLSCSIYISWSSGVRGNVFAPFLPHRTKLINQAIAVNTISIFTFDDKLFILTNLFFSQGKWYINIF